MKASYLKCVWKVYSSTANNFHVRCNWKKQMVNKTRITNHPYLPSVSIKYQSTVHPKSDARNFQNQIFEHWLQCTQNHVETLVSITVSWHQSLTEVRSILTSWTGLYEQRKQCMSTAFHKWLSAVFSDHNCKLQQDLHMHRLWYFQTLANKRQNHIKESQEIILSNGKQR